MFIPLQHLTVTLTEEGLCVLWFDTRLRTINICILVQLARLHFCKHSSLNPVFVSWFLTRTELTEGCFSVGCEDGYLSAASHLFLQRVETLPQTEKSLACWNLWLIRRFSPAYVTHTHSDVGSPTERPPLHVSMVQSSFCGGAAANKTSIKNAESPLKTQTKIGLRWIWC